MVLRHSAPTLPLLKVACIGKRLTFHLYNMTGGCWWEITILLYSTILLEIGDSKENLRHMKWCARDAVAL